MIIVTELHDVFYVVPFNICKLYALHSKDESIYMKKANMKAYVHTFNFHMVSILFHSYCR